MTTAREDDELVTEARLPVLPADTRVGFCEFSRRAGDFALSMALATYRLTDGRMTDVRLGVGGAEERPRRIAEAEAALNGEKPQAAAFTAAAEAAAAAIDPLVDHNTDAEYRRDLVRAMTRRALERAV
jgi:carbon-monoxide dehydrogenase medium subunit